MEEIFESLEKIKDLFPVAHKAFALEHKMAHIEALIAYMLIKFCDGKLEVAVDEMKDVLSRAGGIHMKQSSESVSIEMVTQLELH